MTVPPWFILPHGKMIITQTKFAVGSHTSLVSNAVTGPSCQFSHFLPYIMLPKRKNNNNKKKGAITLSKRPPRKLARESVVVDTNPPDMDGMPAVLDSVSWVDTTMDIASRNDDDGRPL